MVLIKIYPKDTEMYLWSQTSAGEMGLAARRPTMSHEHDPNGDCHDWDMAYSGPGLPPPIRLLSISSLSLIHI